MGYRRKEILACMMCIVLVICSSGCGKDNQWVFSLHGEKLYEKEVRALGIIYANEHNIINSEQLNEKYEGKITYQAYYKEQFSDSVTETLVLYAEAKKEGCKLGETEKQEVEDKTKMIVEYYGEGWLETQNLKVEDIKNAYEKMILGDCYLMAQTGNVRIDGESSGENTDLEEEKNENRYIRVYQVTFPTVELDDAGMVVSNEKGEVKRISAEDAEQKRQEAVDFAEAAKAGEDIKKLLKDYGSTVTGVERVLKYADLDSEYKRTVDGMKKNEVSGVINSDYGYYVIQMLEPNDEEHAGKIENYEIAAEDTSKKSEIVVKLLDTYAKDVSEYRNSSIWDSISFSSFVK